MSKIQNVFKGISLTQIYIPKIAQVIREKPIPLKVHMT